MNIYLKKDGDIVPGDLVLEWIARSDLTPVPRTVEFVLVIRDGIENRLQEGTSIWTGSEHLEYAIVKIERHAPVGVVRSGEPLQAMRVTALLKAFREVSYRRERAVVAYDWTIGALFRACGAQVSVANDFPVRRFACFAGQVPSYHLAMALQEESAVLVLRDGKLSAERIADLFRQTPKDVMAEGDPSANIASEYLERHEIPSAFSVGGDGQFVFGDKRKARQVLFMPRTDQRVLWNMTQVLVTRKVLDSQFAQQIVAGDVLEINGERLVVITAAHRMTNEEGRYIGSDSRFWLGGLSK